MKLDDVYASHADAVRALARRQLGDAADADDVTAATFSTLMDIEGPHRRDAREPEVRSFALAVCANLIRRFRRARARRSEVHAEFASEAPIAVDDLERRIVHRQLADRLARSLELLPEEQRTTLLLSALEEHSAADIARLTGVPEATVRTRLFHARRKLRKALDPPTRTRRGVLVGAGVVLLISMFAFGPRALAAPFVYAYHAVLRAVGLEARPAATTAPHKVTAAVNPPPRIQPPTLQPPSASPPLDENATPPVAGPPPAHSPPVPSVPSRPKSRQPTQPDPLRAEYLRAHQAQFVAHDYEAALGAWNTYLAHASTGTFDVEARYNRAIALAHLGRVAEAREALAPFAAGDYGDYRRQAAKRLLELLPPH
jgi:RNA polymerase sigma-70 factor (ECF subfamily)